jgi:hypothetical protein
MTLKPIWWILIGAVIAFVLMKLLSKVTSTGSTVTKNFKTLLGTAQVHNLIRTNEFREMVKTSEFQKFVFSLAEDEIVSISQALTNSTPSK